MKKTITLVLALLSLTACSTGTNFVLPEGTSLKVYGRPVVSDGRVKMKPFFWNAAGGIPYELVNTDGTVVQKGKLRSKFRPASIFFPPGGIIYWPLGFGGACFDLTADPAAPIVEPGCRSMHAL